jgi:hypothetical protein
MHHFSSVLTPKERKTKIFFDIDCEGSLCSLRFSALAKKENDFVLRTKTSVPSELTARHRKERKNDHAQEKTL